MACITYGHGDVGAMEGVDANFADAGKGQVRHLRTIRELSAGDGQAPTPIEVPPLLDRFRFGRNRHRGDPGPDRAHDGRADFRAEHWDNALCWSEHDAVLDSGSPTDRIAAVFYTDVELVDGFDGTAALTSSGPGSLSRRGTTPPMMKSS
jgi:hypothetical protein